MTIVTGLHEKPDVRGVVLIKKIRTKSWPKAIVENFAAGNDDGIRLCSSENNKWTKGPVTQKCLRSSMWDNFVALTCLHYHYIFLCILLLLCCFLRFS